MADSRQYEFDFSGFESYTRNVVEPALAAAAIDDGRTTEPDPAAFLPEEQEASSFAHIIDDINRGKPDSFISEHIHISGVRFYPETNTPLTPAVPAADKTETFSRQARETIRSLEDITDIETLEGWLESSAHALQAAKTASLKLIKSQYDYGKGVEIGQNILTRLDIPEYASYQEIKRLLIFNAQHIVDSIQDKISHIVTQNQSELFEIPKQPQGAILPYTAINIIGQKFSGELDLETVSALEEYIPQLRTAYYTENHTGKVKALSVVPEEYDRIKREYETYSKSKTRTGVPDEPEETHSINHHSVNTNTQTIQNEISNVNPEPRPETSERIKNALIRMGGKYWERDGKKRVYFNSNTDALKKLYGIKIVRQEELSPADAYRIKNDFGLKYTPKYLPRDVELLNTPFDMHNNGETLWHILSTNPYYDLVSGKFTGANGPQLLAAFSIATADYQISSYMTELAALKAFKETGVLEETLPRRFRENPEYHDKADDYIHEMTEKLEHLYNDPFYAEAFEIAALEMNDNERFIPAENPAIPEGQEETIRAAETAMQEDTVPDIAEASQKTSEPQARDALPQSGRETIPSYTIPVTLETQTSFAPFGAWLNFDRRLSVSERIAFNTAALQILQKPPEELTPSDVLTLRRYSGFGGTGDYDERGVLYDYYTSPPIARMTWLLLNKIKPINHSDRILEPSCGTGVFFETAPPGVLLHGVELDGRTARIARLLHPSAAIEHMSFEAFTISASHAKGFDGVIGNAPFGDRSVDTMRLDMNDENSLDRYFVSRSIDSLKPEGVMAMIVHPGVLSNESNERWRLSLARKAQFLGAVKLNDHSFSHTHTQVQPDLLFFKRHPADIELRLQAAADEELIQAHLTSFLSRHDDYFGTHHNHVMGRVAAGNGQWGSDVVEGRVTPETIASVLECFEAETQFTEEDFEALRSRFPLPENALKAPAEKNMSLTADEVKDIEQKVLLPGAVKIDGASVYILSDSLIWNFAASSADLAQRLTLIMGFSTDITAIRSAMRRNNDPSDLQASLRDKLSLYHTAYASYPKDDALAASFLKKYPAVSGIYPGLLDPSLPILTEKTIYRNVDTLIDGHNPAVNALLTLQNCMMDGTEENIKKYFPSDAGALIDEMWSHADIFLSSQGRWQLREDFISGDAWQKVDELEDIIRPELEKSPAEIQRKKIEKLRYGQEELKKAVGWITIEEADFSPHSSWIPENIIHEWVTDTNGLGYQYSFDKKRLAKNDSGKWGVIYSSNTYTSKYNPDTFHRERIQIAKTGEWSEYAHEIVYYLNMQKQRSKNLDTETFNKDHNEKFKVYISCHQEFRDRIETIYNRLFNTEIAVPVKTYPVHIEGWKEEVKTLKGHQWQSVHHLYRQGKGISALGTGFGKTLAGIALYSLLRQEGKVQRAWFQVPNNKVKDWKREIEDVMPSLKIASIDPEMPGYSSREKRYAAYQKIAGSTFDIIIMPDSAASEIQLSPAVDKDITTTVVHKHMIDKGEGKSAREYQKALEGEKSKLQNRKENKTIYFEDFACNAVFVDEAHNYKNLFTSTLSRETGMNDGRQSLKALSLFKKTEYIRRENNGNNVFLFTATPLTNSPLEYYNMLMYVAPEELQKFNIHTIDSFIKNFADIVTGDKYDWKSGQVIHSKILTGFKNIKTLQNIFFKYTDYQNDPAKVNIVKPAVNIKSNIEQKNSVQTNVLKAISNELEQYINTPQDKRDELFPHQNFLTFYSRLRTASLDIELYDPHTYSGWVNPKLQTLSSTVREIYQNTRGGQLVFCDRVFSSDGSCNFHEKIKASLVKAGFKEEEIAVINGFTKAGGIMAGSQLEKETSRIVEGFNKGIYKILIGSTSCIGEGLNLQENSSGIHHVDIPFRPSDFIQRNGRGDRQGNSQNMIYIHTYLAAGTADNYSASLVLNKANWIDQLLKTKTNVFLNPNDTEFCDPSELLMNLSEEWGDTEKAACRRAEFQRIQSEKLAAEETKKRKDFTATLSLLRSSLHSCSGDTGSSRYQERMRKIGHIEKALLSMPSFSHKEIIGGKQEFLYDKSNDAVIRKGDGFLNNNKAFTVTGFTFSQQTVQLTPVFPQEFISYYSVKNLPDYKQNETVSDISKNYTYFGTFSQNDLQCYKLCESLGFYSFADTALKEKFYYLHVDKCSDKKIVFMKKEQAVILSMDRYTYDVSEEKYLNPFSPHFADYIKTCSSVTMDKSENNKEYLSFIKKNFPEHFGLIVDKILTPSKPELTQDNASKITPVHKVPGRETGTAKPPKTSQKRKAYSSMER